MQFEGYLLVIDRDDVSMWCVCWSLIVVVIVLFACFFPPVTIPILFIVTLPCCIAHHWMQSAKANYHVLTHNSKPFNTHTNPAQTSRQVPSFMTAICTYMLKLYLIDIMILDDTYFGIHGWHVCSLRVMSYTFQIFTALAHTFSSFNMIWWSTSP